MHSAMSDLGLHCLPRTLFGVSQLKWVKDCSAVAGCPVSILNNTCFVSCGKWQPTNGNMCVTGGQNVIQAWDMRTPAIPVRTYEYKDSFGQVNTTPICTSDWRAKCFA